MLLISKYLYIIWNFVLTYLLAIKCVLKDLFSRHNKPFDLISCQDRVCIVTGGSRGIGLEAVKHFAKLNMKVFIASRTTDQTDDVIKDLPDDIKKNVTCMALDLSNIESIKTFAGEFKALKLPLHVLINNAGIMFVNEKRTKEGYEHHWGVNYLGHALLVHLLLPLLRSSGSEECPSRIVNVSSSVHYVGAINFEDINFLKCYSPEAAYAQSKLALVMFTKTLSEKLSDLNAPVIVNCLHPGVVMSDLFENVFLFKLLSSVLRLVLKSTKQGSDVVVHTALSRRVVKGGDYYENCQVTKPASEVYDTQQRNRLWALTCQQLDLDKFL